MLQTVKVLPNSFISCEVNCACTLQLQWYGKSCTVAKDKILLKKNTFLKYDKIYVRTAYWINFDIVDSYKRLIKKNFISAHTLTLLFKWYQASVTC